VTFTAGTIYLLSAANSTHNGRQVKRAQNDMDAVKSCISALKELGRTWRCALQSASILNRLLEEWCPTEPEQVIAQSSLVQTGRGVDVAQMLQQNPTIVEQLQSLGWAPPPSAPQVQLAPILVPAASQPTVPAPAPSSSSRGLQNTYSQPRPPYTHPSTTADEGHMDWGLYSQLGLQPANFHPGQGSMPLAASAYESLFGDMGSSGMPGDTFHFGSGSMWPLGYPSGPGGG
jgi:hypothetical protein